MFHGLVAISPSQYSTPIHQGTRHHHQYIIQNPGESPVLPILVYPPPPTTIVQWNALPLTVLAKFFAFSGSNFCFYSQFWHLYRHYILATRAKVRPGKDQPEIPHTSLLYTRRQWPIFVVEKYDGATHGGVQKPSQSIKIYIVKVWNLYEM